MIKKILLTATIAVSSAIFGQGIKFEEGKLSDILAKAKKENKLVFIDGYTSWCAPCKLMVKKIFPLQTVGDYYNTNFVNAKFDMEKGEGPSIAKKYKIVQYPTYLFLDGDGNIVHTANSYMEEPDFIQFGKDALDPSKQITAFTKRFEKGEKDPEFLKKLAEITGDISLKQRVLDRYYTVNPNITKSDFFNLAMNIKGTGDPLYQVFQNKKAVFLKAVSEEDYNSFDKGIKIRGIKAKAYNKSNNTLDEKYYMDEMEKVVGKEEANKQLLELKTEIAYQTKDYATFEKVIFEKYKDYTKANPSDLGYVASMVANSDITTKSTLEKAILWAKESNTKMPVFMNDYTLAKLYNKTGDKASAKTFAEKAIEKAKTEAPDDVSEIQELLETLK
ncbi:Thioredoxin [Chryseobacterium sp. RU37D]|uniref:thioredoxin family protein n=1 Tax=Chryseobacterium sp. RU37D TaxID=1907397 RepID=UPI00095491E3|nr:thioredoxin fold domain-containing protein [Chryseobacterium sp. RU37D]SIQ46005.1 Thioredoxin [Chryseobacterium sp. RU37D]